MKMDDNASEAKKPVRKSLSKTTQRHRSGRSKDAQNIKKREETRNSEEICDSCSSPSCGRPGYSAPIKSLIFGLYPNSDTDDNGSESERPVRKPLSQTTSATQFQENNEAVVDRAAMMQKSSKRRQKNIEICEKKGESSRSPSSGRPEYSSPTKVAEQYRAWKRNYLILVEECATLTDGLEQVERDIEILEAEKHALLDKLVVLEGLDDDSDLESSS